VADVGEIASIFPASVQAYATVVASFILGTITIYGYFRKMKSDLIDSHADVSEKSAADINSYLQQILEVMKENVAHSSEIIDLIKSRVRQEEVDRAYARGRDDSLDSATRKVASELRNK
jgi:hypothetical protein